MYISFIYPIPAVGEFGPHQSSLQSQVVLVNFEYLVNGVAADLPQIARRAYAEGLITRSTFVNLTNPAINVPNRAGDLVSAIQKKIEINHEAFSVFLRILRKEPVVSELADTLEEAMQDLEKTTTQRQRRHEGGLPNVHVADRHDVWQPDELAGIHRPSSSPFGPQEQPDEAEKLKRKVFYM